MAISTDTSVYISGVTTYVSPAVSAIASDASAVKVSYPVGAGHTFSRDISVPRLANGNVDETEWESRLDSHLLSVNNKVNVGSISTVPTPAPTAE
tara:strand:- start:62 stop:346 length:285 start_codon:yes stop_codon:yes gene_type:complete